jgi:hypothetical protein
VAKAKRKASTTQWIALRGALALAVKHYGSTELAKKMLLRDPKRRYRALDDNGISVEGVVSDLPDRIDWEESSARTAFQMVVLGSSAPARYEQPSRRLHKIELLRADVPGAKSAPPREAVGVGGSGRPSSRDLIREKAISLLAADAANGALKQLRQYGYDLSIWLGEHRDLPQMTPPVVENNIRDIWRSIKSRNPVS